MALPTKVNIGTAPGNGTGDTARTAFDKLNKRDEYLDENKAEKSELEALETTVSEKETPAGAQEKADQAEANANAYTDAIAQGFKWKTPVDVATTANTTLSGEQTIDGVLTAASRILVKDQTDATENGIYVTDAGTWTRTTDADEGTELVKATTRVVQGTQAGKIFTCNTEAITLGTTEITFVSAGDATDHNSTLGIQGGTTGERYHLTLAQLEKLNGLEEGATGDMTGAEIKTLYENQPNTNPLTDARATKLDGIPENIEPAFSKNTAFNKNFGKVAGTVAQGDDSRFADGVTAKGWGNHAEAGYALDAETVKTVNNQEPDENGNVTVESGETYDDTAITQRVSDVEDDIESLEQNKANDSEVVKDVLDAQGNSLKTGNTVNLPEFGGEVTTATVDYSIYNIDKSSLVAQNAATPLTIPTYDGSGEVIHPRVLYFKNGWNGYKYWMCFTPYPDNNPDLENPSIVVSNDPPGENQTWSVPTGLTNPVFPQPASGYNSDAELVYDESNDLLWLVNRLRVESPASTTIQMKSTSDGVNWSATEDIVTSTSKLILSPTIVPERDGFRMFNIEAGQIQTRTATTVNGTYSAAVNCLMRNQPVNDLWHISVNKVGTQYHAFVLCRDGAASYELFFADTTNPVAFNFGENPMLTPGDAGSWDENSIYQVSGIVLPNGNYGIYYSGAGASRAIGYTEMEVTYFAHLAQTDGLKSWEKMTADEHANLLVKESDKLYVIVG